MGAGTPLTYVRNRTLRVGEKVVQQHSTEPLRRPTAQAAGPVVVGLDGCYIRSRHRQEERHRGRAGGHAPTVLCDGDAGLWRLQREVLPGAMIVLDWWHAAVRFEHALQAARGLGAGTADTHLADEAVRGLERAKWRLWHGRWTGQAGHYSPMKR